MKEIRWHGRAGQGAKTASQVLAVAQLRSGLSVQAFPEYGPERRGAPIRAFNRVDARPIRRHDAVTNPDVVVVLEHSLLEESGAREGLKPGGIVLVNSEVPVEGALCVPAGRLAASSVNVVMLGALAAALGEPPLETLIEAAEEVLGRKADPEALRAALEAGYESVEEAAPCLA